MIPTLPEVNKMQFLHYKDISSFEKNPKCSYYVKNILVPLRKTEILSDVQ